MPDFDHYATGQAPDPDAGKSRKFRLGDRLADAGGERYAPGADRRGPPGVAPGPARVAVIDDDPRVRDAIGCLLASGGYQTELHEAPASFLAVRRHKAPNCLIVDIRLRTESGLDFQEELQRGGVRIPVVLISGFGDVPMTVRGMKQGAVDFLVKPFRPDDLLAAVAQAVRVDRRRREDDRRSEDLRRRHGAMSPREQQIMALVVAGLMNKQIAAEIGLAEATIKIHRSSVMRKMAAASLADLVRMGEELGVRDPRMTRFAPPDPLRAAPPADRP